MNKILKAISIAVVYLFLTAQPASAEIVYHVDFTLPNDNNAGGFVSAVGTITIDTVANHYPVDLDMTFTSDRGVAHHYDRTNGGMNFVGVGFFATPTELYVQFGDPRGPGNNLFTVGNTSDLPNHGLLYFIEPNLGGGMFRVLVNTNSDGSVVDSSSVAIGSDTRYLLGRVGSVPEPSSLAMAALGFTAVLATVRRRRSPPV